MPKLKKKMKILLGFLAAGTMVTIIVNAISPVNKERKFWNTLSANLIRENSVIQPYEVYSGIALQSSFLNMNDAIAAAKQLRQASIRLHGIPDVLWNNFRQFTVYQGDKFLGDFEEYPQAVKFAKGFEKSKVLFKEEAQQIWTFEGPLEQIEMIDAPLIGQMPELPRGCEVTSLAMMLRYAGINTNKMELAVKINKNAAAYEKKNGTIHYGNPYDGFVGDMYTFSKPGYGVYHGPIYELAEQYLPGRIIDMTGSQFEDILYAIEIGRPVWVISNTLFSQLPDSLFQTWETPTGKVQITYKEHSVLVTGYDDRYIYFNDPLAKMKNRKVAVSSFRAAWEQMGSQAITYL